jgi:hypothetical protein
VERHHVSQLTTISLCGSYAHVPKSEARHTIGERAGVWWCQERVRPARIAREYVCLVRGYVGAEE